MSLRKSLMAISLMFGSCYMVASYTVYLEIEVAQEIIDRSNARMVLGSL